MKTISRPIALSLIASVLALFAGCAKPAEQTAPANAPTPQVNTAPAAAAPVVAPASPTAAAPKAAAPAPAVAVPAPAPEPAPAPAPVAEAEVKKIPSFAGIPAAAIGLAERTRLKAEQGTTGVNSMFNDVMTKAQTLLTDKRLPEALKALDALDDLILTPDQQKKVDALKAQITQAMQLIK